MAKRYLEDDVKLHADFDDPMVMDFDNQTSEVEYRKKFNLFVQTVNVSASDIYDNETRTRLMDLCSEYYYGNEQELAFLEQFNRSYTFEQALTWYMRGSCLHRLLCRAFLEHDMSILVDMYSFIADIDRNIEKSTIKPTSPVHLYRGQLLSNEQYALVKNNLHQVVTMQCFLMGQTSRDETLRLLQNIQPSSSNFKRILLEIEATTDYTMTGNGTHTSALFRLGSTFRVADVTETTVKLVQYPVAHSTHSDLSHESPSIIRGLLSYLKYGATPAIAYFKEILSETANNDLAIRSSIYGQLGFLEQQLGNHSAATKMYEQSLQYGARQFTSYLFYLDQAAQYHGAVVGDWKKAEAIWLQKLTIQQSFASEEERGRTYENLARAALETKQYAESINFISSALKALPADHPHHASLHEQMNNAKTHLVEQPKAWGNLRYSRLWRHENSEIENKM